MQECVVLLFCGQACLNGHKETAELFLLQSRNCIGPLKYTCFLGLLGAQCINRNSDFDSGVAFWRQALNEMRSYGKGTDQTEADDLVRVFQQFHIDCLSSTSPATAAPMRVPAAALGATDLFTSAPVMRHSSIFRDVRLCQSVDELDALASNHSALVLQALLVLQTILGPSHTETLQQVFWCSCHLSEYGINCW